MQTQQVLNFINDDTEAGFRLHNLELYNWGTFDHDVWRIDPMGNNSLLTGDIGSGKSTLVDAVTTLLVPHHRIVYNKAAGAEIKERTLYSYISGEFKKEKNIHAGAKRITLRDNNSYTVLLGYFYNKGLKQGITLAQVFWIKDGKTNPERFFVIFQGHLTISEDFSNFGNSILDLKKRFRKMKQCQIFENFKEYSNRFQQLFGIHNRQALDLFYQTVSMKSVGNLTEFVRKHMLERPDIEHRIDELRRNFDNLNLAHEAVLKAKQQITALTPLIQDCHENSTLDRTTTDLRLDRDGLNSYFAAHKVKLLNNKIQQLKDEILKRTNRVEALKEDLAHLRDQEGDIKESIAVSGGNRLDDLQREMERLQKERDRKLSLETQYNDLARRLSFDQVTCDDVFFNNLGKTRTLLKKIDSAVSKFEIKHVDAGVALKEAKQHHDSVQDELKSLRSRKSNIPARNLIIRKEMAEALDIDEDEIPFIGELLQVDEAEKKWEGAVERLLHNFGLSLLVPESLYKMVSRYVDRTNLKGRLVYFRIKEKVISDCPDTGPGSLINKLRIKPDCPFYEWLDNEIKRRFNYTCCDHIKDFHRFPMAVTQSGQIKSKGFRHEKDDRHSIHDRRRYVLGWSNEKKIMALESKAHELEAESRKMADQITDIVTRKQNLVQRRDLARDILKFETYDEINWHPVAKKIQVLQEEKKQLEESSDVLLSLKNRLSEVQQDIIKKERQKEVQTDKRGGSQRQLEDSIKSRTESKITAKQLSIEEQTVRFPNLETFRQRVLPDTPLSLQNLDKHHSLLRGHIRQKIDNSDAKSKRLVGKIIQQMQAYKGKYPAETIEVDANIESVQDYEKMLVNLKAEDLPQHEARFKQLLNEGTINSIALFQNQLDKEKQEIEKKIRTINTSLREIEYNTATYIELVADPARDPDIRDFQQELKGCLSNSLDENNMYNESKFLQVKKLIDRFNGREGLADLDRKWTKKVSDVRNWFTFSAIERWQEDDSEKEYYSDSSGKSGGQKEKLAYTILASALAYQFGLEWGSPSSRSFRFVVIDEAFGKGSDESTRYGLELFKKLNLQLLIVTPLQKINIIEEYIRAVHFVSIQDGKKSMIKNLTVEEYMEEKQKYKQGAGM